MSLFFLLHFTCIVVEVDTFSKEKENWKKKNGRKSASASRHFFCSMSWCRFAYLNLFFFYSYHQASVHFLRENIPIRRLNVSLCQFTSHIPLSAKLLLYWRNTQYRCRWIKNRKKKKYTPSRERNICIFIGMKTENGSGRILGIEWNEKWSKKQ